MILAHLDPPHLTRAGDWYYRSYSPGRALADTQGWSVVTASTIHRARNEIIETADVLVLMTVVDADLLPVILRRRARGQITIFELGDDLTGLPSWNPSYPFFSHPDHVALAFRVISACDGLQVTCPELANQFGVFARNGNVRVFRNHLLAPPPTPTRSPSDMLVVGWGGSAGHREDMRAVAPALLPWVRAHPDVRLHIMGAPSIASIFAELPPTQLRIFNPGDIDAYYAFVATLDVGIAPLLDSAFNRSRSDVKWLEYAAHGVAPIVQDAPPYRDTAQHGVTALFFQTNEQLIDRLDAVRKSPSLRNLLAKRAFDAAVLRTEHGHAVDRADFYQGLLGLQRHTPALHAEPGRRTARMHTGPHQWRRLEGAQPNGTFIELRPTQFEALVHDGLVAAQDARLHKEVAEDAFLQAEKLAPGTGIPSLYRALLRTCPEEDRINLIALLENPLSVNLRMRIATNYRNRGMHEAAERHARVANRLLTWPNHGPPEG